MSLKLIKECNSQMISTNLSISTCSVEKEIKAPSTPNDLRIDIRTVSEVQKLCPQFDELLKKPI